MIESLSSVKGSSSFNPLPSVQVPNKSGRLIVKESDF